MGAKFFDSTVLGSAEKVLIGNVLESSTEYSVIGKDLDGKIVLWNEGARRMYPGVVLTSSRQERDIIESYRLGVNSFGAGHDLVRLPATSIQRPARCAAVRFRCDGTLPEELLDGPESRPARKVQRAR